MPIVQQGQYYRPPPGLSAQEVAMDMVKHNVSGISPDIVEMLGVPGPFPVDEGAPQQTGFDTITMAYNGRPATEVQRVLEYNIQQQDTWHARALPAAPAGGLGAKSVTTKEWPLHLPARRAPVTPVPRITKTTEVHVAYVYGYGLGGTIEWADMQGPNGRENLRGVLQSINNGIIAHRKEGTHVAISLANMTGSAYATPAGIMMANYYARTVGIHETTFSLHLGPNSLEKLVHSITAFMSRPQTGANTGPTMAVFAQGGKDAALYGSPKRTQYMYGGQQAIQERNTGPGAFDRVGGVDIYEEPAAIYQKIGDGSASDPMEHTSTFGLWWISEATAGLEDYTACYGTGGALNQKLPNFKKTRGIGFLNYGLGDIDQDVMTCEELIRNCNCWDNSRSYLPLKENLFDSIAKDPEYHLQQMGNAKVPVNLDTKDKLYGPFFTPDNASKNTRRVEYWGQQMRDYADDEFYVNMASVSLSVLNRCVRDDDLSRVDKMLRLMRAAYDQPRLSPQYVAFVSATAALASNAAPAGSQALAKNEWGVQNLPDVSDVGVVGGQTLSGGSLPPGFSTIAHMYYLHNISKANRTVSNWTNTSAFGTAFRVVLNVVEEGVDAYERVFSALESMYGNCAGSNHKHLENILLRAETAPEFISTDDEELNVRYALFQTAFVRYSFPTWVRDGAVPAADDDDNVAVLTTAQADAKLAKISEYAGGDALEANDLNRAALNYIFSVEATGFSSRVTAGVEKGMRSFIKWWNSAGIQKNIIKLTNAAGAKLSAEEFLKEYYFDTSATSAWAPDGSPAERASRLGLLAAAYEKSATRAPDVIDAAWVATARAKGLRGGEGSESHRVAEAASARAAAGRGAGSARYLRTSLAVDPKFFRSDGTNASDQAIYESVLRPSDITAVASGVLAPQNAGADDAVRRSAAESIARYGHGRAGASVRGKRVKDRRPTAVSQKSGGMAALLNPQIKGLTWSKYFVDRWANLADPLARSSPFLRAMILLTMCTPVYGAGLVRWNRKNMVVPLTFIPVAPSIKIDTLAAYFLRDNVGFMYYDFEQFVISAMSLVQVLQLDATFYAGGIVTQKAGVFVAPAVQLRGYVSGMDKTFNTRLRGDGVSDKDGVDFSAKDPEDVTGSLFVLWAGASQTRACLGNGDPGKVVDLGGRVNPKGPLRGRYVPGAAGVSANVTYPCALAFCAMTAYHTINDTRPFKNSTFRDLVVNNHCNTICVQGRTFGYNQSTGQYDVVVAEGSGPLKNIGAGDGEVFRGVGTLKYARDR